MTESMQCNNILLEIVKERPFSYIRNKTEIIEAVWFYGDWKQSQLLEENKDDKTRIFWYSLSPKSSYAWR